MFDKKGNILQILTEIFFIILTIIFFTGIIQKWVLIQSSNLYNPSTTETGIEKNTTKHIGHINVMLLGVDSVEGTHRSDTILIMGINPKKSKISLLSVPRDTRVIIGNKARKINEVLPRYGEQALSTLIEDLMHIKIDRFVKVDFNGFRTLIDMIGGIDINIEKNMNYDDDWGKLHIHFKKGFQHLNGKQALEYVRFRADAHADLGRIKRQQKFIKLLIKKALTPSFFIKLPQLIKEGFKYIQTDFTLPELLKLTSSFSSFNVKLENTSLPGEARYINHISYFLPYKDKAIELGSKYFSDLTALEIVATFTPTPKKLQATKP